MLCHPIWTRHLFSNPPLISWYVVVTSMPITPNGFVIPISLMLQISFVKSLLCHKTTQIVDFPTHIPGSDDCQPYLLDIFLCSNPDTCIVASHTPLGKSDHIVVSVDAKFVVKSTNEHPYHRTVYKMDWDGLRDHLRDVSSVDIFKYDATCAAEEITEWVEMGIDC